MAKRRLTERRVSVAVALVVLLGIGGLLVRRAGDQRRAGNDVTAAELTGRSGGGAAARPRRHRGPSRPKVAPSAPTLTLAFGGDVSLQEHALAAFRADPLSPLAGVRSPVERADFSMVNLDTAILIGGAPWPGKALIRGAPAGVIGLLRSSGVDAVTMANRHGLDYGRDALREAIGAARLQSLPVVGVGLNEGDAFAPYRSLVMGVRVAVLAATQVFDVGYGDTWRAHPDVGAGPDSRGPAAPASTGMAFADDPRPLVAAVRRARPTSDLVVVYLTWGDEGSICPNRPQRILAGRLIAAGADIVVGSGARRPQGAGRLTAGGRQGFVGYGLGDLVPANADPGASGEILELTVSGRTVTASRSLPVRTAGGLPVPIERAASGQTERIAQRLRSCAGLRR